MRYKPVRVEAVGRRLALLRWKKYVQLSMNQAAACKDRRPPRRRVVGRP